MTDYNRLQPGPELDALIAEKVMGWRKVLVVDDGWIHGQHTIGIEPSSHQELLAIPCPKYSTNVMSAWEVVEKTELLTQRYDGERLDIGLTLRQGESGQWIIGYCYGVAVSRADTAPHAICLAALETVANYV